MNKPNIFEGIVDDLEAMEHVGEIRRRKRSPTTDLMMQMWPILLDSMDQLNKSVDEQIKQMASEGRVIKIRRSEKYVPPAGLRRTETGRIVNDRMHLLGKALEQQALFRSVPAAVKCEHEWPEDRDQIDMNGSCTKCGMAFMLYINFECP
jgi:hypothetical protein